MQAENDFTLLRFKTDIRNFHAILTSLGQCFEGAVELRGTSEVGLALLFILLGDGEVILLNDGPIHYC